jgi:hypothetical protein
VDRLAVTQPRTVRRVSVSLLALGALLGVAGLLVRRGLPPRSVDFSRSTNELDAYDFVEVTAQVSAPHAPNPFEDASLHAVFQAAGGKKWRVQGFCDSDDGSVYRVRFMPSAPGEYAYSVEFRQGGRTSRSAGTFHVRAGGRRGPIRVDPEHRWHFVWEGTGEHYFFNGTTAYWLMGWRDDAVIDSSIERLHRLKINRLRVTIAGRTNLFYGEPVMPGPSWSPFLTPWPPGQRTRLVRMLGHAGQRFGFGEAFDALADAGRFDDLYHPGFDYGRFDVSYWQKFERALRLARDRDMIFSLVLDMNNSGVHPAAGSDDERRFIRYAVARLAAFSNITWDLGDDIDLYRDEAWTRATGTRLKQWDPYRHLATSHPTDNAHQDRTAEWFDFTSLQEWSRQQHAFMLAERAEQEKSGRIIPQTNEEYGYEDHHPMWTQVLESESADTLRRMAWQIAMAGGYQTAGESARRGTNVLPDTGGGWMNGRGDDAMTMFEGYGHMVDFFTSFAWWEADPHDELVSDGDYCLAKPGDTYAVYLPRAGRVTVRLEPGSYRATWWEATTGRQVALPSVVVTGPSWSSPAAPGSGDWALLLQRGKQP